MHYFVTKPVWLRWMYSKCIWDIPGSGKAIYLTFDDGPDESETPFVLDQLKQYGAKATFFCIGNNVQAQPGLFRRILDEGHAVGNHTWQHRDGWRTSNKNYFSDIEKAAGLIHSPLFRPPYGHVTPLQVKRLARENQLKTVMWSITSGDFDVATTPERCYRNIARNIYPGAIVLMHDSKLAAPNMRYALPRVLSEFSEKGYVFKSIENGNQS